MRKMLFGACAGLLALFVGAQAAESPAPALATSPIVLNDALGQFWGLHVTPDGSGMDIVVMPLPTTTYQGTIALSAATSTTLTSGNVTMASSTALPATFARLVLINVGSNAGYICWFGGTASATAGCEQLGVGASDTVNLANFATAPTLFSTSGTTFAFHN